MIKTDYVDITLLESETAAGIAAMLSQKFNLDVTVDVNQTCPGGTSFTATGHPNQLRALRAWCSTSGVPRPDLQGKPPVGKGQRRT